jgi:hypothetical protein
VRIAINIKISLATFYNGKGYLSDIYFYCNVFPLVSPEIASAGFSVCFGFIKTNGKSPKRFSPIFV